MIEDAIYARLAEYTDLTDLIGTDPVRVHALVMPQGEIKPAVVVQRISKTVESASGSDTGDSTVRVQVESYGDDYVSARAVATQVRKALQRYSATIDNVEVQSIFIENDFDDYDPTTNEWRVIQDYRCHYKEA